MDRRRLLGRLAGGAAAAGSAGWWLPAAARGQRERGSQGIGLTRDEWEALHGRGEVGQSLVSYEGGRYVVGFDGDVVTFVERGWEDEGNVRAEESVAEVLDLLPADARLTESYYLPATAGGPISLLAERYRSRGLGDALAGNAGDRTDTILVLYQETPAEDRFEPDVSRVSIAVGMDA